MKKAINKKSRRRKIYASIMLAVILSWLPLSVVATSCFCSAVESSFSALESDISCHDAIASQQEAAACHSSSIAETVNVSSSQCCSSGEEAELFILHAKNTIGCKAACDSSNPFSTIDKTLPNLEQRIVLFQQIIALYDLNLSDIPSSLKVRSEITPEAPPPLFLLHRALLI